MKTVYTLICSFFLIAGLQAQTQTLFDGDNTYGGFGGPILEFSQVNGQTVVDVGGGGALVMNDFFIGGYGMGTTDATVNFEDQLYDIRYGHGGFWFGYTAKQHKLIHLYSSFRIGWGDVELRQNDDKDVLSEFNTCFPSILILRLLKDYT